jgi:hypothetical protein
MPSFDKGIYGRIILKWVLQNRFEVYELDLSGSMKNGEFV